MNMNVGINLEFSRTTGIGYEIGMRKAAEAGYLYVEPYAYSDVELLINSHLSLHTQTPYHHIHTKADDAQRINELKKQLGLEFSMPVGFRRTIGSKVTTKAAGGSLARPVTGSIWPPFFRTQSRSACSPSQWADRRRRV